MVLGLNTTLDLVTRGVGAGRAAVLGKVIATATGPGVATERGERQSGDHCNNVRTVSGDPHYYYYYYHYHVHQLHVMNIITKY